MRPASGERGGAAATEPSSGGLRREEERINRDSTLMNSAGIEKKNKISST